MPITAIINININLCLNALKLKFDRMTDQFHVNVDLLLSRDTKRERGGEREEERRARLGSSCLPNVQ